MVLVQNKYKNTLVGVLRTDITSIKHSSPSFYVTLRTKVIGNLFPQKTDSAVLFLFVDIYLHCIKFKTSGEKYVCGICCRFLSQRALLKLFAKIHFTKYCMNEHNCHGHGYIIQLIHLMAQ